MDTSRKSLDKNVVQIIVEYQPSLLEIQRYHGLIVAIIFISIQVSNLGAMTREMEKNGIARPTLSNNVVIGSKDIGFGWVNMVSIIYQDSNIGILESMKVLNVVVLMQGETCVRKMLSNDKEKVPFCWLFVPY